MSIWRRVLGIAGFLVVFQPLPSPAWDASKEIVGGESGRCLNAEANRGFSFLNFRHRHFDSTYESYLKPSPAFSVDCLSKDVSVALALDHIVKVF